MRGLRISLYFLPLLLVFLAYYFLASMARTQRKAVDPESITFAITTVPLGIDPLTQQDPISEEIESLLFDRLIGRTPTMQLEGRLAENWNYGATLRYFFLDEKHGANAWETLAATKDQWPKWGVIEATPIGADEIRVELNSRDTTVADQITAVFSKDDLAEITKWSLETNEAAGESVRTYAETALEAWQIRHLWSNDSGKAEFFTAGRTERFRREVNLFYESNPEIEPKLGEAEVVSYLATPRMTVNLRNGVRWHDGKPFTVDDVLHSVSMAIDSESQAEFISALETVERIEPHRPLSFTVHFRKPFARTLEMWEQLPIIPAHALHFHAPNRPGFPPLVGTGPFTIEQWVPEQPILLRRNEDYFRGIPDNHLFVYERVLEARMRRILFQINVIDSYEAKPTTYANLESRDNFNLVKSPPVYQTYLAWNLEKEVFKDFRVRKALSLAIDREALVEELLGGNGIVAHRLFHPRIGVGEELKPPTYNVTESIRLLEDAGWNNIRYGARHKDRTPLSFKLAVVGGDEFQRDLARALLGQWRRIGDKVGAQVQLHIASYAELSKIRNGNEDFDAVLLVEPLRWHLDQFALWHSSEIGPGGGNFSRLNDAGVDRIVEQIRAELNEDRASQLAGELEKRIFELQPISPLFLRDSARVFQSDRAIVIDKTTKSGPETRPVGANQVSLTHDLAWWVKKEQDRRDSTQASLFPLTDQ